METCPTLGKVAATRQESFSRIVRYAWARLSLEAAPGALHTPQLLKSIMARLPLKPATGQGKSRPPVHQQLTPGLGAVV